MGRGLIISFTGNMQVRRLIPKNRDLQRTQVKRLYPLSWRKLILSSMTVNWNSIWNCREDPVETDKMICWMSCSFKNRLNGFFQPGGLKYAMMWKIDELFRAKRLSLPSYLKAGIKISIFSLFSYWLKNWFTLFLICSTVKPL